MRVELIHSVSNKESVRALDLLAVAIQQEQLPVHIEVSRARDVYSEGRLIVRISDDKSNDPCLRSKTTGSLFKTPLECAALLERVRELIAQKWKELIVADQLVLGQ